MDDSLTRINEDKETFGIGEEINGMSPVIKERIVQQRIIGDCDLRSITVFLDKAEICRTIPITLDAHQSLELKFSQLSPFIDKDSIRCVSGDLYWWPIKTNLYSIFLF